MNEHKVQNRLYRDLWNGSQLLVPNYTPAGWWECDMLQVTKSGYGIEHEIKLTRSDFMADAKKSKDDPAGWWKFCAERKKWSEENKGIAMKDRPPVPEQKQLNKHQLMAQGSPLGPKQFYYVTPEGLIDEGELPDFAGLKTFKDGRHKIKTVVKAPVLHKNKVSEKVLEHARGVFYYRYWNLRA